MALVEASTGDIFVAVTVHGTSHGTGTLTEKGVYGVKRLIITVYAEDPPILDRVFNIVARARSSDGVAAVPPPPAMVAPSTRSLKPTRV